MQVLEEQTILEKIRKRQPFVANIAGGAFSINIQRFEPTIGVAIHNGSHFSTQLSDQCALSKQQRYYEEDPYTGSFVANQGITLIAHDSRYAYDLNRPPQECVYQQAWGKKVWTAPLSKEIIQASIEKHSQFYRILDQLITVIVKEFSECVIYDMHSYNYKRYERTDLPIFNLGTITVNKSRWKQHITKTLSVLQNIRIPGLDVTVAENDIFFGKGYLASSCHKRFNNVLVLPIEVKKIYMNELTGESDPAILPLLQEQINSCLKTLTKEFFFS